MITVLCVDIVDSRKKFKGLNTHTVIMLLNDFYQKTVPILMDQGALLEKYTGDGFIAVWLQPEHDKAIATGKRIISASPFQLRIGVATGNGFVAHIGWSDLQYLQAIGDAIYNANRCRKLAAPGQIVQWRENDGKEQAKSQSSP